MQVLERSAALAIKPLWRLGFRPFFLYGSLFAVIAVALWMASLHGYLRFWNPTGGSLAWHRHEMLFGFGIAIVAGFLLTAVQTWTSRPGLSGRPLQVLFVLWLLGRLAWFIEMPVELLVAIQMSFLPVMAWQLARPIVATRQRHNYPVILVLSLMCLCQGMTLYGLVSADDSLQRRGVLAALWLIAGLMGIIGGRVIPFFTQRGLGRTEPFPARPNLDRLGLGCSLLIAGVNAAGFNLAPHLWLAPLFLLVAVLHGMRLVRWYDAGIWRVPLLWSLHVAYAWLMFAALGMVLWHVGVIHQPSSSTHALSVGAMGGLILAMLARVSLGHTGRALQPPKAIVAVFVALHLAAISRVFLAVLDTHWLWFSALCWSVAFLLFLRHYAHMFCTPRVDGHPG